MTAQKLDFSMLCDEQIEGVKVRISDLDKNGYSWVRFDGGPFCSLPINVLDLDQMILILSQVREAVLREADAEST